MTGPDPDSLHPLPNHKRVVFLAPLAADRENVTVGAYAYYDDPDRPETFFDRNVLHHHDFMGDHLTIGAFTAIATGAEIIMNGANHNMTGFSTYPFEIFDGWGQVPDMDSYRENARGDTVIGPDVWIGAHATILPGVTIGPGAIIGTRSVVGRDVPPYAVVVGNPARVLRRRFDDQKIERLLALAWWDWPADKIARNIPAITSSDLPQLEVAQ